LSEDAQGGSVIASKDGTVVPSDNMDMKNKMPSGNNTAVNVFVNFQEVSQMQRVTGNNKSTVVSFLHTVLFKWLVVVFKMVFFISQVLVLNYFM